MTTLIHTSTGTISTPSSTGIFHNTGSGISGSGISSSPQYGYFYVTSADSPDLPEMRIQTIDEHNRPVMMTLIPEPGISSSDTMKLMMLIMSMTVAPEKFNALAYVKKQNLERHFKWT